MAVRFDDLDPLYDGEQTIPQLHNDHNDIDCYARFRYSLGGGFRSRSTGLLGQLTLTGIGAGSSPDRNHAATLSPMAYGVSCTPLLIILGSIGTLASQYPTSSASLLEDLGPNVTNARVIGNLIQCSTVEQMYELIREA